MIAVFGLLFGFALLIGGGGALVKGASGLAERSGLSPIVIGLTIVAFGTSAPELAVNIIGALENHTELSFGNVVGSNIANLGLVLGIAAMFGTIEIHGQIVRRELPLLLLVTAVIVVMASDKWLHGEPSLMEASDAIILLLLFCVFLYVAVQDVKWRKGADSLLSEIEGSLLVRFIVSGARDWFYMGFGIAGLFAGGHLTVTNGIELATVLNVPTAIIGLFVIAVGTSLPELVTSAIAAMRRESDLALGNVIGSNLFNGLFVLPVSALMRPLAVPEYGILDLFVSFLFALALIPIFWLGKRQLGRKVGAGLLIAYFGYAGFRIL